MKIVLCVKQVPDTSDIKWTENNTMQREGVEAILNPFDAYSMELALRLKKLYGAEINVFTMGPAQADLMLRKLIALGADNAFLISDRKFAGADTYATGKTVAKAISKFASDFDLILCGQFAIDGDTAQTGPCIASFLNIPQVTYVHSVDNYVHDEIVATRIVDDGIEKVSVKTPVLMCVLQSETEISRPLINGIIKAQEAEIKLITADDLEISPDDTGLKGSPTYVSKAFRALSNHNCEKYFLNNDAVEKVADKICEVRGQNE